MTKRVAIIVGYHYLDPLPCVNHNLSLGGIKKTYLDPAAYSLATKLQPVRL